MKFSIRKMQAGGGLPPFTYYQPVTVNNSATPAQASAAANSSATSKSGDGGITDKDLLKMLGEIDGLPSDMSAIFNSIQELYAFPTLGSNSSSILNSRYLSALQQVKVASFNKKEYDNAYKQAISNNTLPEYAITDQGKLVAMDSKGTITTISLETLNENQGKYQLLTNSNLLKLRADSHPMDNSILSVVQEGVSMDMVNKYIQQIADKIGTSNETLEGYSETSGNNITKGIQFLKHASAQDIKDTMQVDGTYKSSIINKSQRSQAKAALNYIYQTLPVNMRTLLELKGGSKEGGLGLIGQIINSGLDATSEFKTSLVLDENGNKLGTKTSTKSDGSGSTSGTDLSPALAFIAGKGDQKEIQLNPGSSFAVTVNGYYGIATDSSGHALGENATLQDLSKGSLAGNLDFSKATMGGARIQAGMYDRVLLNDSTIVSMDLPIRIDEMSGLEIPDFTQCKKLETVNVELRRQGINPDSPADAQQIITINQAYQKAGLSPKFDQQGQVIKGQWKRFAAVQARADERAFGKDPTFEHDTIAEVTDDNVLESFVATMAKNDKNYKLSGGFFGFGKDNVYQGTIFIPLSDNLVTASLLSSDHFKVGMTDANEVQAAQNGIEGAEYQRMKNYNNPGGLATLQ